MKKIALACFIGGALMCAVALVCAPNFWWLGLLAGLAGGYISYEFHEVLQAVPIAWRKMIDGTKEALKDMAPGIEAFAEWFHSPHPFLLFGALCGCLSFFLSALWCTDGNIWIIYELPEGASLTFVFLTLSETVAGCCGFLAMMLADDALTKAGCQWQITKIRKLFLDSEGCGFDRGRLEVTLTYATLAKWALKGASDMLKQIITIGVCLADAFIRFIWQIFKLIHSSERLLCAIDGTLGGIVAYFWLTPTATTLAERTLLIVCGGLLGAAFGIAHKSISEWLIKTPEPASA